MRFLILLKPTDEQASPLALSLFEQELAGAGVLLDMARLKMLADPQSAKSPNAYAVIDVADPVEAQVWLARLQSRRRIRAALTLDGFLLDTSEAGSSSSRFFTKPIARLH